MSFSRLSFVLISLYVQVFIFLDLSRMLSFFHPINHSRSLDMIPFKTIAPWNLVCPCFFFTSVGLC